ncbi:MAG: ATP-binding protein [Candidatus Micrarchaeota archaeon]
MFIDRETEKVELSKLMNSKKFEFGVLYGRRRIGKTRLILEVLKKTNYIYYLAVEKNNLPIFISTVAKKLPEALKLKENWEVVLDFLKNRTDALVIDEFQNLIKEDKTILSVFQRIIDTNLKNGRLKLFILGSSVSMISSHVLQYKSPLYGRKTMSKKIQTIGFFDINEFFPKSTIEERIMIYGFADGIPYYLEKIKGSFWEWLEGELAHPTFIKDELDFILKYEFEDLGTYKTILEAIAYGKTTIGEIKNYCKMQRTDISPYLSKLMDTEFIYREIPITDSILSKMGRYYIKDQFIAFWFKYIYPNLSSIEEGIYRVSNIKDIYSVYTGFVFEKICKQFIIRQIKKGKWSYVKIGKWWYKDNEIDIVAIDEKKSEVLFAECKWQDNVDANIVLEKLTEKIQCIQWRKRKRKEKYVIFAKSFIRKKKMGSDVLLYDLKDLEGNI